MKIKRKGKNMDQRVMRKFRFWIYAYLDGLEIMKAYKFDLWRSS